MSYMYILLCCIVSFSFCLVADAAELKDLPFPYYLSFKYQVKQKKIPFVPENTYAILEKGEWAMIGPLLPCQCFIFICEKKTFLAHLTFNSSYTDLCNKIKQQIPPDYDRAKIKAILFTNESWLYDTICEQSSGLVTSWKDLYNGKIQQEVLENIKNHIITSFALNLNQVKIKTSYWGEYGVNALYPLACLYLVIRNTPRGLLINNICPMNVIRYFNQNYSNIMISDEIYNERQYIKKCLEYPDYDYEGKTPLLKVDKSTYFSFDLK